MNAINSVNQSSLKPAVLENKSENRTIGFADRLKTAVEAVNERQQTADQSMEKVVNGTLGIHEGMINISQADISLRLLTQVRNKAMEAYKEIMHMQF